MKGVMEINAMLFFLIKAIFFAEVIRMWKKNLRLRAIFFYKKDKSFLF